MAAPPGAVAISGDLVVAALAADGAIDLGGATVALRGQPGAVLWGLGAGDGEPRFTVPIGATDWVVVRDLAGLPGGDVAVAGSFTGTLRLGDRVVSSAGSTDGFVARVGGDGTPRWLIRIGGADGDGVSGVAAAPDGVAVAGTFAGEAEIRGVALTSLDDTILPDGFVASLDGDGGVRWARTFGSSEDDQVAGVAVTPGGVVAVAATIRGVGAAIGDRGVMVRGLADAVVVAWDAAGTRRLTRVIGGQDLDTASAIAAVGDELVVGVTYAGTVALDSTTLTADGGDGAAIVVLDGRGEIRRALDVAGPGRETVAALAGTPAGFAAVIRHTAGATLDGATLAAPADPYGGGAILVRGE
ncbi:MAG: hypothetical protein H6708_24585 [Kofleriaceae bacterium]|nr:hypothetical protein [Kofleriaceae bacterium]